MDTEEVDCFECLCEVPSSRVSLHSLTNSVYFSSLLFFRGEIFVPFVFFIYLLSFVCIFQPVAYKVHKFFLEVHRDRFVVWSMMIMATTTTWPFRTFSCTLSSLLWLFFGFPPFFSVVLSRLCNAYNDVCVRVCNMPVSQCVLYAY